MPAKDRYHDTVVRSLHKAGWTILAEQLTRRLPDRKLWIDIRARKNEQAASILVEVKGFENMASPVTYLSDVLGQVVLYRVALHLCGIADALYLAVPLLASQGLLTERLAQVALSMVQAHLLVFDPETEEIVQWQH
jgi:hypothetical protein